MSEFAAYMSDVYRASTFVHKGEQIGIYVKPNTCRRTELNRTRSSVQFIDM
jgi:hypothetical protein